MEQKEVVSFRAGKALTSVLAKLSKIRDMSVSDLVRETVEKSANPSNSLRALAAERAADYKSYLAKLIDQLDNAPEDRPTLAVIDRVDLYLLLEGWHTAYLHTNMDLLASPRFMLPILQITEDLMQTCVEQKIRFELDFIQSKLNFFGENDFKESIDIARRRASALKMRCGTAEMKTRALVMLAPILDQIDTETIEKILPLTRLKDLLPVSAKCLRNDYRTIDDSSPLISAKYTRKATMSDGFAALEYHPWSLDLYVLIGPVRIQMPWQKFVSRVLQLPKELVLAELRDIAQSFSGKDKDISWDDSHKTSNFVSSLSSKLWPVNSNELGLHLVLNDHSVVEMTLDQAVEFFTSVYDLAEAHVDDIERGHTRKAWLHFGGH